MPRDHKLLEISRKAIEPYVIDVISQRKKTSNVRLSTLYEDTSLKIDGFVTTTSGKTVPIQVKTRQIKSSNFTIGKEELANTQNLKVFCFVDKTFDEPTLNSLLEAGNAAIEQLKEEGTKVYAITQEELQSLIDDKRYFKEFDNYYVISKHMMHLLN